MNDIKNIDLNLYKVFYIVAKTGSISKAAKILFVSQPAISYSIKLLEESLGSQLFFRTSKGVTLTPEAKVLYSHIKDSFNSIIIGENLFKENKELLDGDIYIGCYPSLFKLCLQEYINIFHQTYPKIRIHIVGKSTEELTTMLQEHKIDMFIKTLHHNNKYLNFEIKKFFTIHHCFICNEKFKDIALKKSISVQELSTLPLLLLEKDTEERMYLDNAFAQKNIELTPIMELSNYITITSLTKLGHGIGYAIKESVAYELQNEELFEIHINGFNLMSDVNIVYDDNYLSCAAKAFLSILP